MGDHDHCYYHFYHLRCLKNNRCKEIPWFFNFCSIYLMGFFFCFLFKYYLFIFLTYFPMYLANALTIILCVLISPSWHSVICQLDACYLLLAFLFYPGLILNSIANWDFFSNTWCQRYQHSAILLTASEVWNRSGCLWKASLQS